MFRKTSAPAVVPADPSAPTGWRPIRLLPALAVLAALSGSSLLAAVPAGARTVAPQCFFSVNPANTANTANGIHPACGSSSDPTRPSVDLQPVSQSVVAGAPVTFSATASGNPTPTEQWLYSFDGGSTWNPFTGRTEPSMTLTADVAMSGDLIEAVFVNSAGVAYSDPALLTVAPQVATTTTLTASANPIVAGSSVTYTATVSPARDGGAVSFSQAGSAITGCERQPVVAGAATCTKAYPAAGAYVITAGYLGDLDYTPSTATALTESVNPVQVAPAFNGASAPQPGVGEPFNYRFAATGSPAPTVTLLSGAVPAGLQLSSNGTLSGTPTTAATYTFSLRAVNGVGTPAVRTVSLVVRPKPSLSVANASVTEGNSGTRPMTFTGTLSRATSVAVTVHWRTANGTAVAGSDYVAASGNLTIPAGQTNAKFSVVVKGDTSVEPAQTFTVSLSAPTGATLGTAKATGKIVNDD